MDYTSVSSRSEENHVCNTLNMEDDKPWMYFRGGWSNMNIMYAIVCQNDRCKSFIDNCGLGRLLEINVSKDDQQLTHAIVERFWKSTNTFHFPTFEIGLTPNDFTWLTGIEVENGVCLEYIDWCVKDNRELCVEYVENLLPNFVQLIFEKEREKKAAERRKALEGIDETQEPSDNEEEIGENGERIAHGLDVFSYLKQRSGGIKCVDLLDWLRTFQGKGGVAMEPYWDEIVRVFLLWMIGQVLMPNSVSTTKVGWLCNFENLDNTIRFNWGSPTLACLYKSLGEVSSKLKSFNGMWMILEYWFYYYFHTLAPQIEGNPPVWNDLWPKIKVFNKGNKSGVQRDMGRHSISIARKQLENRSMNGTTWQPWLGSEHANNEVLRYSKTLSKKRCVFLDIEDDKGYRYLGERCLLQVTGVLGIPPYPPPQKEMVRMNRKYREKCKGMRTSRKPNTIATIEEYEKWWSKVSVGAYFAKDEPILLRGRNRDNISSSSQAQFLVPYPPPMQTSSYVYENVRAQKENENVELEYLRSRVQILEKENELLRSENEILRTSFRSEDCYAPIVGCSSDQIDPDIVNETQVPGSSNQVFPDIVTNTQVPPQQSTNWSGQWFTDLLK